MTKKYYAAYGSNLNIADMRRRCPEAEIAGTAELKDYALVCKGLPPRVFLTLEPQAGGRIPLGIWAVTARDEAALDRYEDHPALYRKETVRVRLKTRDSGRAAHVDAFLYIMAEGMPEGTPDDAYRALCRAGFRDFGFDEHILDRPFKING
ncbi:gamma-glutamylcyclotransferase family protein [Selenomonas sp. F0473]|uniref:gamma-glutamylcyclotransferase family protein n=1 Tax=Selenomonas sp. F0473 TaxID=999423 RepID=UPI0025D0355A|nr:gamma-glutamylcyclotransferase family protein [Selenomonas sp. F0473]